MPGLKCEWCYGVEKFMYVSRSVRRVFYRVVWRVSMRTHYTIPPPTASFVGFGYQKPERGSLVWRNNLTRTRMSFGSTSRGRGRNTAQ